MADEISNKTSMVQIETLKTSVKALEGSITRIEKNLLTKSDVADEIRKWLTFALLLIATVIAILAY